MTDAPPWAPARSRQPWLHHLETAVHGNVTALGHATGDVDAARPDGRGDRAVRRRPAGAEPTRPRPSTACAPVRVVAGSEGATTECLLLARNVGDPGPDPTVEVRAVRARCGARA